MEHILTAKGTMPKPETISGASIPEYIEIKATDGSTVAFLSPEADGLECWIDDEQNGTCTLEMELPLACEKWQYLTDKYRIYADDKEFVILNPDAVDKQRDGKKLTGKIKAHESWVFLGKKFPTISNDPQNPNPPWGAVIIVSGGAAHGGFDPGSAGSALSYLLQGTGWTVGTVDVTGTYDLETEKESVLYNINQVQGKWGGILVWDSVNKTVSLRDEEAYQPYAGYQIRYAKNLKGISRVDDYDIVTRLYPFGENDLNIANVNGGLLYLDNQSYSTEVLEGVWYNQDIADQTQLKTQTEKQLAVMCKPRHNYKTEVLDLRSLPGYGHETFARSDMVDLLDEDFGANARVRIIRYRHNVFQPWLCDMELGDPIEKISATVAQTVLMAKFYKNVVKPNESFQNLLKAIINTAATEINGASGDYTLVDGVSTWLDRDDVTGELTGKLVRITPQGLIISYDGGQTWKLAISGEGIHADAGWVGKLNAGVVTVGADTTFEAGYDPTQITADSVGMGVDADCVGLWHFDGSLNSHKGVAAITTLNPLFDTGCFGSALKSEGTPTWTNIVGCSVDSSNNLIKTVATTAWDAGAISTQSISGDGYVSTVIAETNTYRLIGLGNANVDANFTDIEFAIYPTADGTVMVYESGVQKWTGGTYTTGDILKVAVESGVVKYYKNSTLLYTSAVVPTFPLYVDTSLYNQGATLKQVKLYGGQTLKVPTTDLVASQGTINLRAKNLSASANGSVLVDLPKSDNSQGLQVCISSVAGHEGEVYIVDSVSTVYGPNKSTLTAWDSISLAWSSTRLSLVVNDSESCFIENPGLPAALGNYLYIGTDRNGANAINTLVDELRIDKVYRDVATRTAWHKTGVPFYTSEDMKQWPGYLRAETDGVKVYDAAGDLRVLLGSWLENAVREYGLEVIKGKIYSSLIQTGTKDSAQYIAFEPPNKLVIYAPATAGSSTPVKLLEMLSPAVAEKVGMDFYDADGLFYAVLAGEFTSSTHTLSLANNYGKLQLRGSTGVDCSGDFRMTAGTKYNVEQTENYGNRGLAVRESPEQKYVDEGFGVLVSGECRIDIDPIFMECIEPHTPDSRWYIQLTPYADVDLYVAEIGDGYFVIKERKGGTSTGAEFTWSLSATRKDYAMIRFMEVLD